MRAVVARGMYEIPFFFVYQDGMLRWYNHIYAVWTLPYVHRPPQHIHHTCTNAIHRLLLDMNDAIQGIIDVCQWQELWCEKNPDVGRKPGYAAFVINRFASENPKDGVFNCVICISRGIIISVQRTLPLMPSQMRFTTNKVFLQPCYGSVPWVDRRRRCNSEHSRQFRK